MRLDGTSLTQFIRTLTTGITLKSTVTATQGGQQRTTVGNDHEVQLRRLVLAERPEQRPHVLVIHRPDL